MDGLETMLGNPAAAERMTPLLKKNGLAMRSFYMGGTLHDSAVADATVAQIVATAAKARELLETQIVVVNPTPLGGQGKSDEQLDVQAAALTRLGKRLAEVGVALSYHFHAPEWAHNGREFYHVMAQTDPKSVHLCLDAHWVYRGSGNHAERVYEVVERYGERINELHIRQSQDGVWTECVMDGDIDYRQVVAQLKSQGVKPLLVLEQAVEGGTPKTMDAVESHRRSRAYVDRVFRPLFE
jgi:inosose dehydratase